MKSNNIQMTNSDVSAENGTKPLVGSSMVANTYLFPNGMVATFGHDDEQIPELQGRYSAELKGAIAVRSDKRTKWHGF